MAKPRQLSARRRDGTGKGAARPVRREARIPAVIYGAGEAPVPISLDGREATRLVTGGGFLTTLFEISLDGASTRAIPRDYQLDPVRDTLLHVDFLRLAGDATLRVEVPVRFVGHDAAPGLKRGGTLNVVRHTVEMTVPADRIPEAITGDLSGLDINDALHISNIPLPEGCRPTIGDRDFTVATIAPPTVLTDEEEPGEGEDAATA